MLAAIPKPASTVVLMDDESRVYLTKRPETMKFMGGFHVFPGGAVELEDHVTENERIINEVRHDLNHSFYFAAARELFEEVGVLLGERKDGLSLQMSKEKQLGYRQDLLDGKISFSQLLEVENLYLNLQCLTYFGQIITPEENPIRFDTRFFLTKLPIGQNPDPDQTEIDEALWIRPVDALAAYENRKMILAPPTIIALQTIINHRQGGELMMSVTRDDLLKLLKNHPRLSQKNS